MKCQNQKPKSKTQIDIISSKVLLWQSLDESDLKDRLFEEVLKSFAGMIYNYTNFKSKEDREDLRQELSIQLFLAMKRFNPKFQVKFSTYMFHCFKQGKLDWGKNTSTIYIPRLKLNETKITYENADYEIMSKLNWNGIENRIYFEEITKGLTPDEFELLRLRMEGYTLNEIGDFFNIRGESVRLREISIYNKIREKIYQKKLKDKFKNESFSCM